MNTLALSSYSPAQRLIIAGGILAAAGLGVLSGSFGSRGMLLSGAVVGAAAIVLLLLRSIPIAIGVLLLTRASLDLLSNVRLGPLNMASVLALLVILAGAVYWLEHKPNIPTSSPLWPYLLFVTFAGISAPLAPDALEAVKDLLRFASLVGIFIIVTRLSEHENQRRRFAWIIALSTAVPTALAIVQFLIGDGLVIQGGAFVRPSGTFLHPNPFGIYLSLAIPVILALLRTEVRYRLVLLGLLATSSFAIVVTFTRTAWIGLLVAIVVMGVVAYRRTFLVLPVVLLALVTLFPDVAGRFDDLDSDASASGTATNSLSWRLETWSAALDDLGTSPLWGNGLDYLQDTSESGKQVHNDFIRVLIETGIVGLVFFLATLWRMASAGWAAYRTPADDLTTALRLAFLAVLAGYIAMTISSNLISQPAVQWYLWALAAIALAQPAQDEVAAEDDPSSRELTTAGTS